MAIFGTHDAALVVLSVLIAVAASYTALDLASRVRVSAGWPRHAWLATAALAMGGGVWSMHFVAMLAFGMPGMAVSYDIRLTVLSLVIPVLTTGIGFLAVSRPRAQPALFAAGGLFMGLGIAAMHYTGMAAMTMAAEIHYDRLWVAVSVLIAIGAATVALWLSVRTRHVTLQAVSAVAMGMAVSGMHYAAMQAAVFTPHAQAGMDHGGTGLTPVSLALAVAVSTFLILFLALVAAMFDRRFAVLASREAEALRHSEERFRALYTRTPLPLHSLDRAGRIEHVTEAWLQLLGFERDAVIGRPLAGFMTEPSARRAMECDWPRLLRTGVLSDAEYRMVARDGRILDVLASARVEQDAQGGFRSALGGLTDVTERKRAEEALRQSQKMEAVGQLTGGVAHDFNNLLTVVIGSLELLRKRLPAGDVRAARLLENAVQSAERGAALTQRLLAFSRGQALRPVAVGVPGLVRGMSDLLRSSLGPGIQIETQVPAGVAPAYADANQLELALLNLAVNARDAMEGRGVLTISARDAQVGPEEAGDLDAGRYVVLSVADTGEGMDEATLARCMDPFFTTKGVGKGTGLGLSMVYGLATQSGGTLLLRSRKGQGTTAELWLPRAGPGGAAPPWRDPEGGAAKAGTPPRRAVLVVDDDPLVLASTACMLEELGHDVLEAASGQQALEMLQAGAEVEVVVTDQAMPGMSGRQLADALRQLWPRLPVLLATGYAERTDLAALGLPLLGKPFSQAALAAAIENCVAGDARPGGDAVRLRHAAGLPPA